MFQRPPRESERLTWTFFAVWAALIFTAVPIAPKLLAWLGERMPLVALIYGTIAVIFVATLIAVIYIYRQLNGRFGQLLWLMLTLGLYVYFCIHETNTPQEALHFLEYGFLGLLGFRALSHRIRDVSVYPMAVILVALVGTTDEIIQWMTPGRYWDFHDIRFDALSAALAQVVLAKGMRPPFIAWRVPASSVRILCRLALGLVLLFGFCIWNTPPRVVAYASRIPFLSFLLRNETIMNEFGYRHTDREIGTFYSRFSTEDLRRFDRERGEEVGRRVAEAMAGPDGLQSVLYLETAGRDPFLYEFASHIEQRNHYSGASWKYAGDDKRFRYHQTVAYRENQILETYFGHSLTNSGATVSAGENERWKSNLQTEKPYRSRVSSHLVTKFRSHEALTILLASGAFFVILHVVWGRERATPARNG